jgi:hypothetical protein
VGDAGANLQPQSLQVFGDQLRGLSLLVPQLRMLVNSMPVADHLRRHAIRRRGELLVRGLPEQWSGISGERSGCESEGG